MASNPKKILQNLKKINFDDLDAYLAIVNEYKRDRVSHYLIKYVKINDPLEKRLKNILSNHIKKSNSVDGYTYDSSEPDEDQVKTLKYEETDFYKIIENLGTLNPEEDVISEIDELLKAKSYLLIFRDSSGIKIIGFKTLPENWKMKKQKGLIPLLFKDSRFEDLEDENIFSISRDIDVFYFNEILFILSKKNFERGLNFRDGMINNAESLYQEVEKLEIFINLDELKSKVGNNQRYLRKIAIIRNLGHFRNKTYLKKLKQISKAKKWNINYDGDKIVITEDTLDDILTLLQNKRLHSELTLEDFDVENPKPIS